MRFIRAFSALSLLAAATFTIAAQQPGPGRPDDTRFTPVVLISGGELDEPMIFQVLRDGRVLIIERKGALKMYEPATKRVKLVATIPVNHTYTNAAGVQREAEEGLVGLTLDPAFEQNGWIYMLYADPDVAKHTLARWELQNDQLAAESKNVLLEYGVQREQCCHTGGGMAWDRNGNLYMTVGNNTANSLSAQTDERPGRSSWDDQRGAANTNDLRGKILRIHPEPDGTYTIPAGNLFPPGTPNTRPEIYTMGNRNPWRPFIDSRTGYLYWGEVGPDAVQDSDVGPMGYDEHNQARGPGNFGWPYFIGKNRPFPYFDFALGKPLAPKDPTTPTNTSANNTGLRELPPARPALVAYPYGPSEEFPLVGSGARSANGGPIYHRSDFTNPARPFPPYYEGKWFISDFSRGWIMAVTLDGNSNYVSMERFLPDYRPVEIIDNKFGPDGDFYILEYGSVWFGKGMDAKLVRIEYNGGNRPPALELATNRVGGAVPLQVALSSAGTKDYDGDQLRFEWTVTSSGGDSPRTFTNANPTVTLDRPGVYTATLTVTDAGGANASKSVTIVAGNEPPSVAVTVTARNKTFFFDNQPISYSAQITDSEDSVAGGIAPGQIALGIDYVPEDVDIPALRQDRRPVDASTRFAVTQAMMATTDCRVCHDLERRSAGPSFREIGDKHRGDSGARERLVKKVLEGGSGVWGDITMPAHPAVSAYEARQMVDYMLGVHDTRTRPLSGSHTPVVPEGESGTGSLLIRAVYTDRGANGLPALTSDGVVVLRSAHVAPATADVMNGVTTRVEGRGAGPVSVLPPHNTFIAFRRIDLTGITRVDLSAQAPAREAFRGGTIQVRLDSPNGELLGEGRVTVSQGRGGGGGGGAAPAAMPTRVTLKPVTGERDVYFVFANDMARPRDLLFSLTRISFSVDE